MVTPAAAQFDPRSHLCFEDVQVDSRESPSLVQVWIKASKMDPFRQGVTLVIGKTNDCLCPVTAVLAYMVARGLSLGPLFTWEDKRFLTRESFVGAVVEEANFDWSGKITGKICLKSEKEKELSHQHPIIQRVTYIPQRLICYFVSCFFYNFYTIPSGKVLHATCMLPLDCMHVE